jgi:hypothetical protein
VQPDQKLINVSDLLPPQYLLKLTAEGSSQTHTQALPDTRNFKLRIFLKVKLKNFFKLPIFYCRVTAQRDEVRGRVLMGDNAGGGAFGQQLIRMQNDGVWTFKCTPLYIQT